jgi:DNA-binding CsgD family transcriptional regulator
MKNSLRRMDGGPGTLLPEGLPTFAAFETALGMIPQPTFVVSRAGQILHANALGEQLLGRERVSIQRSLVLAALGEPRDGAWRLTALDGTQPLLGFIAVLDPTATHQNGAAGDRSGVRPWHLTARQAEVLGLVAGGATNAAVAEALGIKKRTVEFHLSAIFDKAGVDNRATLIARLWAP